ncbi:hypothetical protein [Shewanella sp. GD03713]|nr:hypothetical protein [Shewanella sp. GD03713]MDH1472548.1 hypothetical protein [Shewanella sp. GD03713]
MLFNQLYRQLKQTFIDDVDFSKNQERRDTLEEVIKAKSLR